MNREDAQPARAFCEFTIARIRLPQAMSSALVSICRGVVEHVKGTCRSVLAEGEYLPNI
jgi:hypothetical protein